MILQIVSHDWHVEEKQLAKIQESEGKAVIMEERQVMKIQQLEIRVTTMVENAFFQLKLGLINKCWKNTCVKRGCSSRWSLDESYNF